MKVGHGSNELIDGPSFTASGSLAFLRLVRLRKKIGLDW